MDNDTLSTSSPEGQRRKSFPWKKIFGQNQSSLLRLYESESLIDVTLVAGANENKVSIPAHRVILSLASGYFWGLFVEQPQDDTQIFKVAGIDPLALKSVIKFIYTARLDILDHENETDFCEKLFNAADVLDVRLVQVRTLQYMMSSINIDNCGQRLTFARNEECEDLTGATVKFIDENYAEVLTSTSFLQLEVSVVVVILHCEGRLVTPEESVFTAVVKWLKYDENERKKHSATLLREIDLSILPEDFLQFHFDKEPVLHTYDSLQLYTKVLKKEQSENSHEVQQVSSRPSLERTIYLVPHSSQKIPMPKTKLSPILSSQRDKRVANSRESDEESEGKKIKLTNHVVNNRKGNSTTTKEPPASTPRPMKMVARKRTGGQPHHYNNNTRDSTSEPGLTNSEVVLQKKSIAVATRTSTLQTKLPQTQRKRKKEEDDSDNEITQPNCSTRVSMTGSGRDSSSVHRNDRMNNNTSKIQKQETRPSGQSGKKTSHQVIVYLRESEGTDPSQVMMHDLSVTMTRPKKLHVFHRFNKSCILIWASAVNRLLAIGGVTSLHQEIASSNGTKFASLSALMDPRTKKLWQSGPDMVQERNNFQAVILNDYVYAFGGSEGICGNQAVNCAEKLSLTGKKAKWEEIDYLQRARQGFGAITLNGLIYVVGGYGAFDGSSVAKMGILNTVEVYDPVTDAWKFVCSMNNERHGLSVVAFDSKIYAIGGGGHKSHISFEEDILCMKSVEVYDPETDEWEFISSMNHPRKNGSAVVMNGTIYIIGGDHSKGEDVVSSSVEKYDFKKDKWIVVCKFLDKDKDSKFESVAVVDLPESDDDDDDDEDSTSD